MMKLLLLLSILSIFLFSCNTSSLDNSSDPASNDNNTTQSTFSNAEVAMRAAIVIIGLTMDTWEGDNLEEDFSCLTNERDNDANTITINFDNCPIDLFIYTNEDSCADVDDVTINGTYVITTDWSTGTGLLSYEGTATLSGYITGTCTSEDFVMSHDWVPTSGKMCETNASDIDLDLDNAAKQVCSG